MTLAFYMVAVAVVIFAFRRYLGSQEPGASMAPRTLPPSVDTYEIAYLRGGENELTRVITVALAERGYLLATEKTIERTSQRPLALPGVEQTVYDFFSDPRSGGDVFESDLARRVGSYCLGYEERLQQERLVMDDRHESLSRKTAFAGVIASVGMGWLLGPPSLVVCLTLPIVPALIRTDERLSSRGNAYIAQLKAALSCLDHSTGGRYALVAAVAGIAALAGTPFEAFAKIYSKAASSDGTHAGCGDGGGGGCGGCGGCGG